MKDTEENVLGPYKRFILWLYGCHRNCDGCIFHKTDDGIYNSVSVSEIVDEIISNHDVEGITISGGEPFDQGEALLELVTSVREKTSLGIIIYTGYTYKELLKNSTWSEILDNVDLIIDGEYVKSLDMGNSLIGSSNQKVIFLTNRYKDKLHLYERNNHRVNTVNILDNEIHTIGIPVDGIEAIVRAIKRTNSNRKGDA